MIIELKALFDVDDLKNLAKGRFKTHAELKLIEFKIQGKYYRYNRKNK